MKMKKILSAAILTIILALYGGYKNIGDFQNTKPVVDGLSVHFIDVGQADSTLLMSGEDTVLIDGGNVEDSNLLYSYLTEYNVRDIDYIIATHPHEDHMGGLSGALERADVGKIYLADAESDATFYKKFIKKAEEKQIEIKIAQNGESFVFGDCLVTLMVAEDVDRENLNNTSVMARVQCGERSFLFTGDAERETEAEVIDDGMELDATVLKAPHHGSDSSSSYPFLRAVMPEIVVISAGEDNSYGHPHKEVLSRYKDLGAEIYRTDRDGHIIISTDGETLTVTTAKNKNEPKKSLLAEYNYIGNSSSKKLHLPSCSNLPKEKNRVYFDNRKEAIDMGYTACGGCNP